MTQAPTVLVERRQTVVERHALVTVGIEVGQEAKRVAEQPAVAGQRGGEVGLAAGKVDERVGAVDVLRKPARRRLIDDAVLPGCPPKAALAVGDGQG